MSAAKTSRVTQNKDSAVNAITARLPPSHNTTIIDNGKCLRFLTEIECERLMGLPDNYTGVPYLGRTPAAKSHRISSIGNSIAVPCLQWIGEGIAEYNRNIESTEK